MSDKRTTSRVTLENIEKVWAAKQLGVSVEDIKSTFIYDDIVRGRPTCGDDRHTVKISVELKDGSRKNKTIGGGISELLESFISLM